MKKKIDNRIGNENLNNQGCLMKVIEYNGARDIVVEFQDCYNAKVHTTFYNFKNGLTKNPYFPSVHGVGIAGNKYPRFIQCKQTKEYSTWASMLNRVFNTSCKEHKTYSCSSVCDNWLVFDNFYEWLHSQSNFDNWLNGDRWNLDKDIIVKGNKLYSPDTCCLVPHNINSLFVKKDINRGDLPIGVCMSFGEFEAQYNNNKGKKEHLGKFKTPEEAFFAYKKYKENLIKNIAKIEFDIGNITEECYNAMLKYEVEITD